MNVRSNLCAARYGKSNLLAAKAKYADVNERATAVHGSGVARQKIVRPRLPTKLTAGTPMIQKRLAEPILFLETTADRGSFASS